MPGRFVCNKRLIWRICGAYFNAAKALFLFKILASEKFACAAEFRYKVRMPPDLRPQNATKGFSLIELLITLALLCVLSVMLYGFGSASHQRSQKKLCADNLQKIYLAMQIYANDFGGRLPQNTNAVTSEDVLDELVPRYTADTSIFICPGGRDAQIPSGEPLRKHKISYAYYMGTGSLITGRPPDCVDVRPAGEHRAEARGRIGFFPERKTARQQPSQIRRQFSLFRRQRAGDRPLLPFSLAFTQGVVLLNPKP